MAKQLINIGSSVDAKNGDPIRVAFTKINSNFSELFDTVTLLGAAPEGTTEITLLGLADVDSTYSPKTNDTLVYNKLQGKWLLAPAPQLVNVLAKVVDGKVTLPSVPRGPLLMDLALVFVDVTEDDLTDYGALLYDRDYEVDEAIGIHHINGVIRNLDEYNDKYIQVSYMK
jgi:hypothetical protein